MEFAAINNPKSAAKTLAITLTNDEAKSPTNAFAALLNIAGTRFNTDTGLSQVEGQWLRGKPQRDDDIAAKPKADRDPKPHDKAKVNEDAPVDESDDAPVAAKTTDDTDDVSANDNAKVSGPTEAQPADQVTAVGLEAVQTISIQFQILVQLPTGELKDAGTFDLQTLLAAASQDSSLASALEAAFAQAASSLSDGQSLLGDLQQAAVLDPAAVAALQQAGVGLDTDTIDANGVSQLFKQIAAALHPLAQQAATTTNTSQSNAAALATAAAATDTGKTELELLSPEAARQSAELSRILGDDSKVRIQVVVAGKTVADMPFEWSSFNRFSGYNPEAMRTMSTANGQAGQGQAGNALISAPSEGSVPVLTPAPVVVASNAAQPVLNSQQNSVPVNNGSLSNTVMPRSEAVQARAPDAPAPANSSTNNSQSQPNNFAATMNQTTGSTATQQTASPERPAAPAAQVIEQIKVNITRAAKAGLDRVTIQLRPEELGRIEIKLEMTQDGNVRASITAENPATLELLQREARGLERALQDAGLHADASDLEFNLRNEANDRLSENGDERGRDGQGAKDAANSNEAEVVDEENFDYGAAARMRGGVDTYA